MLIVTTYKPGTATKPSRVVAQFLDRGGEPWTRVSVDTPWNFDLHVSGLDNHSRALEKLLKHPVVSAAMVKDRLLDRTVMSVDHILGPNAKYYWAIFDANWAAQRASTVYEMTGVYYDKG